MRAARWASSFGLALHAQALCRDNALGVATAPIEALVQLADAGWLALRDPRQTVQADGVDGVRPALDEVERLTRDFGCHAVGFVTYEAGAAFGLPTRAGDSTLPLVWFGLFEPTHATKVEGPGAAGDYTLGPLSPTLDRRAFAAAFARIKEHLARGDSYQVNLTFKLRGSFAGDPLSLFRDLVSAEQGRHSLFLRMDRRCICSASPELFLGLRGMELTSRPMKGAARRGRTRDEDMRLRSALESSAKERAENVMIVDMVRNDVGHVAETGSVAVPELFAVERYPDVWQMTSLVAARSTASLEEIIRAMHPPASVTGAPKARSMEIVAALEAEPRGIYTGALGHVWPTGDASFNVAIRTALIDEQRGTIEFGIGSDVVWDSDVDTEYEECLLKCSVLGARPEDFDLVETTRWTPEQGFLLLERHLDRLNDSAEYFGFRCSRAEVASALAAAVERCTAPQRVRLSLKRDGSVRVDSTPLKSAGEAPLRVAPATHPVDPTDRFLFHKTSRRTMYQRALLDGFDDVILWNTRGEVTEATTANVIVEIGGRRLTPPIDCGLLGGTYRAEMLARGEVSEGVITMEEFPKAERIWLTNSVHESRPAVLDKIQSQTQTSQT